MIYPKEEMLKMYKAMVTGRHYVNVHEEGLLAGKIAGFCHGGQGQEAISVGVRTAMGPEDWYLPTHRSQAGQILGLDLKKAVAEQCGRRTGYCGGMACDYHLSVPEKHMMFCNGILGENYGIAVGFAHALKRAGKKQVFVVTGGDGAFCEGANYEAFYLAQQLDAPVVFILEDNGYGWSYKSSIFKTSFEERAKGFGIDAVTVDGNNVLAVREAVEKAIEKARNNVPNMVVCKTLRWGGHYAGGDMEAYRTAEEKAFVEETKKHNDPIKNLERIMLEEGMITKEECEKIWVDIEKEVREAFTEALATDYNDPEFYADPYKVYAEPWEV